MKKKLIEVALPIGVINEELKHEKDVKVGKPTSVHHWWARRPLGACRSILFASVIDDPSERPDLFPGGKEQDAERRRLTSLIRRLATWEENNNKVLIEEARREMQRSLGGGRLPRVLDPFCGGGSIPLEAQRMGFPVQASDLNPVSVMITKALVDIPPRFHGVPPVASKGSSLDLGVTSGTEGLRADVLAYGEQVRALASSQVGSLYRPRTQSPAWPMEVEESNILAWLWARTVKCPNPACKRTMPLISSYALSAKKGKEVSLKPLLQGGGLRGFEIVLGPPTDIPPKGKGRVEFSCLSCGHVAKGDYIKREGQAARMGAKLIGIVVAGHRQRVFLSAKDWDSQDLDADQLRSVDRARKGELSAATPERLTGGTCFAYGLTTWESLFTDRQLVTLLSLVDAIRAVGETIEADALAAGLSEDQTSLADGGYGARAYSQAIRTYLALALSRLADWSNSLCRWESKAQVPQQLMGQQSLAMVWDYAEGNPLGSGTGSFLASVKNVSRSLAALPQTGVQTPVAVNQFDAAANNGLGSGEYLVVTDPPYYANIGYADLSDFYYLWLRMCLAEVFPDIFSTLLTPKNQEIVAAAYRHGNRDAAGDFFERQLEQAIGALRDAQDSRYPLSIFYAFKQTERRPRGQGVGKDEAFVSTGWERMLTALQNAGLQLVGTWPLSTEMASRRIGQGVNALASSIVLVCRPRSKDSLVTTRPELMRELRQELPRALELLREASIPPVDLAQASIGPGMAVFSRYTRVIESDGSPMRIGTALGLINQVLDELLTEQEGQLDAPTRWVMAWFEQHGMSDGPFGDADNLARAKNTSVQGLVSEGLLWAKGGEVRILARDELPREWDPATNARLTKWEVTQRLIRAHEDGGETAAAALARRVGGAADEARDLAYRLFGICDRKGWGQEAIAYNALVVAWPEIARLAAESPGDVQQTLLGVEADR